MSATPVAAATIPKTGGKGIVSLSSRVTSIGPMSTAFSLCVTVIAGQISAASPPSSSKMPSIASPFITYLDSSVEHVSYRVMSRLIRGIRGTQLGCYGKGLHTAAQFLP